MAVAMSKALRLEDSGWTPRTGPAVEVLRACVVAGRLVAALAGCVLELLLLRALTTCRAGWYPACLLQATRTAAALEHFLCTLLHAVPAGPSQQLG